ncbi:hypothetical protein HSBAA_13250 [Vreelandella sulfidaeris]|uniref:Uncharacterized protein n=1 Tax=Vreelandella sulfidaeris TaxID=115553 RepID=A0A455U5D0_9GAMM|nr:hypothetical protein HSBAA_13250 [Halomonas sulfidaeris]
MQSAQARPQPIPVYAEMSSINPVFLLPEALKANSQALGKPLLAHLIWALVSSAQAQAW